jgi:hypothetical protein
MSCIVFGLGYVSFTGYCAVQGEHGMMSDEEKYENEYEYDDE